MRTLTHATSQKGGVIGKEDWEGKGRCGRSEQLRFIPTNTTLWMPFGIGGFRAEPGFVSPIQISPSEYSIAARFLIFQRQIFYFIRYFLSISLMFLLHLRTTLLVHISPLFKTKRI